MYNKRATDLCTSLEVSSWLRHGSNMLCNSMEFKTWTLTSMEFFIWLRKPYTPRKAIEQCEYPIKYKHPGGITRQSVMEGVGHGDLYCQLLCGRPLAQFSPVKGCNRPTFQMWKVELREVKNAPNYVSTAKNEEGFDGRRTGPPCPSQPSWLPPSALGPRCELLALASPRNPSSTFLDNVLS